LILVPGFMKLRTLVFTAVSMKMTVFWDVATGSLVEVHQHFRGGYCLNHLTNLGRRSMHLWNIDIILPHYIV